MTKEWTTVEIGIDKTDPNYAKIVRAIEKLIEKYDLQDFWQDADDSDDPPTSEGME